MTDIICGFFDMVGWFIDSVLPTLSNTGFSEMSSAVSYFAKLIGAANYLFPVDTLFQIMGIYIAYKIYMMGLWLFSWIVRTVRG